MLNKDNIIQIIENLSNDTKTKIILNYLDTKIHNLDFNMYDWNDVTLWGYLEICLLEGEFVAPSNDLLKNIITYKYYLNYKNIENRVDEIINNTLY